MHVIIFLGRNKVLDMDKELTYKKIDNPVEIRKILWASFIVLNGGLGGIIISLHPFDFRTVFFIKIFVLLLGLFFYYFLFVSISDIGNDINKFFSKLEEIKGWHFLKVLR